MKIIFTISTLALSLLASPAPAQDAGGSQDALVRLVNDQQRLITALEARLGAVEQEVAELRAREGVPALRMAAAPVVEPRTVNASSAPVDQPPEPAAAKSEEGEQQPLVKHAAGAKPPDDEYPYAPNDDLPQAAPVDSYGSLRVAGIVDDDGIGEIRDNSSRVGLRGEKDLANGLTLFGRLEVGSNIVSNDRAIITGDPGAPIGQGSQAFFSRLGFVGVRTNYGDFSVGKQWSPYYDVAEFTDQFQIWSGLANGAFGARTDGGISGTGRAEHAFQYRFATDLVSVAVQTQSRSTSPNDRNGADTYGGSVVFGRAEGFSLGAAYNEVRDGVADPNPNQPQLGDKATLFGLRYRGDRFYAAASYSILDQHEIDDLGRRFDGNGFELAFRYNLSERFWIEAGLNDLEPDDDHPGEYRLRYGVGTLVYTIGATSRVYGGIKLEDSRLSDGSKGPASALGVGVNLTF